MIACFERFRRRAPWPGPDAERARRPSSLANDGPRAARRCRHGFWASRSGASALEFAFVAPLFIPLVFSTLEGGWLMTKATLLDRALNSTVRLMRVGSASAPTTQDGIKREICKRTLVISDCLNVVTVELRRITSAADFPATNAICVDRGNPVHPTVSFTPGQRSYIMFIRACAVSNAMTPGIGLALALPKDSKGGYHLISSAAFMNEPGA